MNHSEFLGRLDAAILSGQSLSQIARSFQVNQTTVSRRKAALRDAGHRITNTLGFKPESLRQERGVNDATHKR
jgi:transposase-like protein